MLLTENTIGIHNIKKTIGWLLSLTLLGSVAANAAAESPTNQELFEMYKAVSAKLAALEAQIAERSFAAEHSTESKTENATKAPSSDLIGSNGTYSFKVLDHSRDTNTKQLLQLQALRDDDLKQKVTFGGQITALVNYQKSNSDTKFGWLMRHPTSSNQIGKTVSEAVIHSSNLNLTARLTDNLTGYAELLYNPEQNFASGSSITGLPRNNVNMRRAYLMYGNLDKSNLYASVGKMDIPFGLNDTASPFTNSTNWHSFAGLAYGGLVGYATDKLHLRAMAIQGGAQFRNANTPVKDTNVPSLLNNFALDANYTFALENNASLLAGASYQYGSSYCQEYVVKHFNACNDNVDAASIYARYQNDRLTLLSEFAETLAVWPGTANPNFPAYAEFDAVKNFTWTVGASYAADFGFKQNLDLSLEFSQFKAGAKGSPWEKQDQLVLGASYMPKSNVKYFAEMVHVAGWVPLNFLSGGHMDPTNAQPEVPFLHESWSEQDAKTDVIVIGVQAAF